MTTKRSLTNEEILQRIPGARARRRMTAKPDFER